MRCQFLKYFVHCPLFRRMKFGLQLSLVLRCWERFLLPSLVPSLISPVPGCGCFGTLHFRGGSPGLGGMLLGLPPHQGSLSIRVSRVWRLWKEQLPVWPRM